MSLLFRLLAWMGLPSWVAPLFIFTLVTSAIGGAYVKGRMDSAAACREKELAGIIAAMERDRQIAVEADQKAKAEIARLEQAAKDAEEEVVRYEQELLKRADRCALTPDDVNRLRGRSGH